MGLLCMSVKMNHLKLQGRGYILRFYANLLNLTDFSLSAFPLHTSTHVQSMYWVQFSEVLESHFQKWLGLLITINFLSDSENITC